MKEILINEERLEMAIEWFVKFVVVEHREKTVDFYSGFMEREEGYKREIFELAHNLLNIDSWNESNIGTGIILKRVSNALNAKVRGFNNLVVYHNITKIQKYAERNLGKAEGILYHLYTDEDPCIAFEAACDFWGKWYPELSYLMFIRDCNRFLPVKNSDKNHKGLFRRLGIDTDFLNECSWDNYLKFIDIHMQVRDRLENVFDTKVSLLDAHSFIWTLKNADNDFGFSNENEIDKVPGGRGFISSIKTSVDYEKTAKQYLAETEKEINDTALTGKEKETIVKTRVNQNVFRTRLLSRYSKCCLCGVSNADFLVASHIKPWSMSDAYEKIDPDNGLLLCPNHDKLFDQGYISFSDDGGILISRELSKSDCIHMNIDKNMKIAVLLGNIKYLDYHRRNVYQNLKD